MDPPIPERIPGWRRDAAALLTNYQHFPTPFLTTFLLVHMSAPILANIGGSSLSSQVMLLGREYYQTRLREPLIVWAPMVLHVTASVAKRLLLGAPQHITYVMVSGWSLLLLVPTHVLTHRIHASDPTPPISALSPGDLNFEFVKYGLARWPVISWTIYTGLVGAAAVHAVDGWTLLLRMWCNARITRQWGWGRLTIVAGAVTGALTGLLVIASEPRLVSRSLAARFLAVYQRSVIYRH